ncbi:hypothetical protein LIER_33675 [Lithospermum erythrorhizon]|uniref:Uncharacterized protein n=1 Tax=Lithospermum erythrorhizon TaxID=34254 RepID=A0AAV3S1G1_LITER
MDGTCGRWRWRRSTGRTNRSLSSSQFGNCGSIEQHGFARNKVWTIDENSPPLHPNDSREKSAVDLLLKSSEEDLKCWPNRYHTCSICPINCSVVLDYVVNFSFAYHTYMSISDISEVRIEGLETLDYLDNLLQRERFTEKGDAITFESEVSRNIDLVYDEGDSRVEIVLLGALLNNRSFSMVFLESAGSELPQVRSAVVPESAIAWSDRKSFDDQKDQDGAFFPFCFLTISNHLANGSYATLEQLEVNAGYLDKYALGDDDLDIQLNLFICSKVGESIIVHAGMPISLLNYNRN